MSKRIPTEAELEDLLLGDLKHFLEKNNVNLSSVASTGKTPNRPTKKDYLERAYALRKSLVANQQKKNVEPTAKSVRPTPVKSPTSKVIVRRKSLPRAASTAAAKLIADHSASKSGRPSLDMSPRKKAGEEEDEDEHGVEVSAARKVWLVVFLIVLIALFIGALLATRSGIAQGLKQQ
mmetsp:Transcript_11905/g.25891  ORF Transcript_11905/g.25891 Transcript_11905/m.25891 type:complete len:178 (-) Transcript_11905:195-728(-)